MYQALYRKYRPRCFGDVYGQEHVVSTLKNEIRENRVSHAYLFTGSRGTGKTTCAKILARAINCEHPSDGEPCNECEICRGLESGAIYDVVEIDAASNNGVDNIRDIREEVNYSPSRCKYRVYIIDEVHMLSQGAFNALLKTLEEPPAHAVFILATTEVQKLPATIISRCQRFDFKRIQPEVMAVRLKQVADAEGLTLDNEAAMLIARIADGALRDGLSVLDQCAGRSKNITSALVSEVAGIAGRESLLRLTEAVMKNDGAAALNIISDLYANSYDMERLCTEMISSFRNLMIAKTVGKARELIICTDDEFNRISETARGFTLERIIFSLDLFQDALAEIKSGVNSRIEMETAFIRLCEPKLERSTDALLDRIARLESTVKHTAAVSSPLPAENKNVNAAAQNDFTDTETEKPTDAETPSYVQPQPAEPQPEQSAAEQENTECGQAEDYVNSPVDEPQPTEEPPQQSAPAKPYEFDKWAEFTDVIHKTDIPLFAVLNGATASIVGEHFVIDSPNPTIKEFIKIPTHSKAIRQAVYEVTGLNLKLAVAKKRSAEVKKRDCLEDLINKAQNNVNINFE